MAQYDNTNRGTLGRNRKKEKDTHPDFKGQLNVEGKEYWLSGWTKEANDGSGKFFSLSVQPKDASQNRTVTKKDTVIEDIGDEPVNLDDIPF